MEKERLYRELADEIDAVLAGEDDPIVWMSTLACLIRQKLRYFWVGFYRVAGEELRVGPYQGSLGCLRISFDRGVCGAAATRLQTVLVPDVHQFPGHIACDPRARSEVVVPILDAGGQLRAVLDIDGLEVGAIDDCDCRHLESIARRMRKLAWTPLG